MFKPYTRAEVSFERLREIGQEGNNSQVHVVRDLHLDAELVMKTIAKSKCGNPAEYFEESRILYLSSHSNVVPVHYACQDTDFIYIAMPYFQRGSLNKLMETKNLTAREIIRYACHFLSGLHNIHSKRLIHFDVKPDNILLSDRDEALISDFGLAKQTDHCGLAAQDRMYLKMKPPESYLGDQFSARFDVYQAGLTLYRMANGNAAFYEQFNAYGDRANFDSDRFKFDVKNERFPDRNRYLLHIPKRLRDTINKCLRSDPDQRYSSVLHIINDLAGIGGNDLDWRYEFAPDGLQKWLKQAEGMEYQLLIDNAGSSIAQKRAVGQTFRRITAYCKTNITTQEIKRFLRSNGYD